MADFYDEQIALSYLKPRVSKSDTGELLIDLDGEKIPLASAAERINGNAKLKSLIRFPGTGGVGSYNTPPANPAGEFDVKGLIQNPERYMQLREEAKRGSVQARQILGYKK